jgi:hypothetical protein
MQQSNAAHLPIVTKDLTVICQAVLAMMLGLFIIGMVGFSAGGHLVGSTCTNFEKRTYEPSDDVDRVSCRPDFAIAAYPGYLKAKEKDELAPGLRIPTGTPPIFLVGYGMAMLLRANRPGSKIFRSSGPPDVVASISLSVPVTPSGR